MVATHCFAITTRAPQTSPPSQSPVSPSLSPPPHCPPGQNDDLKSQQPPLRTEGLNNLRLIDFQRLSTKRGDVTGVTSQVQRPDWLLVQLSEPIHKTSGGSARGAQSVSYQCLGRRCGRSHIGSTGSLTVAWGFALRPARPILNHIRLGGAAPST